MGWQDFVTPCAIFAKRKNLIPRNQKTATRGRLAGGPPSNKAISARLSARSSTCDASILFRGIYNPLLIASICRLPNSLFEAKSCIQTSWVALLRKICHSVTALEHLWGRDVITLPRSLQSFELSKMVAEFLGYTVAQDSLQSCTRRKCETSQIVARKNPALAVYAKSKSIFFIVESSFATRKLRTCPGWTPSGLDGPSAASPFQCACSIAVPVGNGEPGIGVVAVEKSFWRNSQK